MVKYRTNSNNRLAHLGDEVFLHLEIPHDMKPSNGMFLTSMEQRSQTRIWARTARRFFTTVCRHTFVAYRYY